MTHLLLQAIDARTQTTGDDWQQVQPIFHAHLCQHDRNVDEEGEEEQDGQRPDSLDCGFGTAQDACSIEVEDKA